MIRRAVIILFLGFFALISPAQERDFGIWYQVNVETPLAKNLEASLSGCLRTFRDASKIEQGFGEIGLSYSPLPFLAVSGSYRFISRLEDNNYYYPRHRFIADLRGRGDIGRIRVSGRVRFQRQVKTYIENSNDEIPVFCGRIRFKAAWRTRSFPVDPYVTMETFARMFEHAEKRFFKYRYSAGAEYSISRNISLDAEYIFEKDYRPGIEINDIFAVGWNLRF